MDTNASIESERRQPAKRRIRVTIAALLAALSLGTTLTVLDSSPVAAASERSVNFTGYCKARYGGTGISVSAYHARVGSWTAVTWRCRQTSLFPNSVMNFASIFKPVRGVTYNVDHQIDVNHVCRWQYGTRSYAVLKGQSWSDWRCVA